VTPKGRTAVVALLVTVIAVRVSVSQPLTATVARIASDPDAALRHAADGWTLAGTLGGASAQGLRDLPLALYYWLGSQLGLSAQVLQTSWRVLVLLLALWGAIRLARALASPERVETWTPWVAAVLFSSGIVLIPTVVRSPLDGLAAATLPWIVAPLLTGQVGWRRAATSAVWLGLAGVGSPSWAAAALVAGFVAAIPRSRDQVVRAVWWLLFAAMSCAWWLAAFAWEHVHARDVSALLGGDSLREAVGLPDLAIALAILVALGPLLVTVTALLLRPAGTDLVFIAGLAGAALVVGTAWFGGWDLPLFASSATDPPSTVAGPVLGWLALAALVAWTPLAGPVGDLLESSSLRRLPSGRRGLTACVLGVLVLLTTTAGVAVAAAQPATTDETQPGLAKQVARWSSEAPPGRVLVLPARSQDVRAPSLGAALGDRAWVGRDSLPVSGAAGTGALDDLLGRLSRGDGGAGTSSALRRLGVSYVMLHLDGSSSADRANPSAFVRAALVAQGAHRVAYLSGPGGNEDGTDRQHLLDFGVRSGTELVEIWSVADAADGSVYQGPPVDVVGDAGTTSDLADAGVLVSRAIRIRGESSILSDSARRRDIDQRVPVDAYGPVLRPKEPRSVVPPDAAPLTTATRSFAGARSVSASSSAADLGGDYRSPGTPAMSAIDGNLFTSWQSRRGQGKGEWWEIRFDAATELSGTTVQFVRNPFEGRSVSRVRVATDHGLKDYRVTAKGLLTLVGPEQSARLQITVTGVEGGATGADDSVGIAEVRIPGVVVRDRLVVAGPEATAWVMAARTGSYTNCVPSVPTGVDAMDSAGVPTVCDRGLAVDGPDTGSLDRVIEPYEPVTATGRVWARAADSDASSALAQRLGRPTVIVTGSSVAAQDLVTRPQAAADADTSTAWRPAPEDAHPKLSLTWREPKQVTGMDLLPATGDVASVPTRVRVAAEVSGGATVTNDADVLSDGSVGIPSVRTRSMTITVLDDTDLKSVSTLSGASRHVPIAIAEVGLVGGPDVRYDEYGVHRLDCGSGPAVSVDGKRFQTAITTSAHEVVSGAVVRADLCGRALLFPGEVEVGVPASFSWTPLGVVLAGQHGAHGPAGRADAASRKPEVIPITAPVLSLLGTRHRVTVPLGDTAGERTLLLPVPAATGWEARAAGGRLPPITLDGWSQAWAVPAGVDRVELRYSPGGSLRGWVRFGAVGWALVVLLGVLASLLPERSRSRTSRGLRKSR
jgi:arabinofuranan 3-O-arabinosyltransferase